MNRPRPLLLHGIHEWRQSLDAHFEAVTGLDRSNSAGSASENDVTRKQRHVRGNETHKMKTVEDELAGMRILAQLYVLEQLNSAGMRIHFGFHVWANRCESVERLGASPLAFTILNGAVADVLSRSITENVTSRRRRRNVAHPPANHNSQLRFEIGPVIRERHFDFCAIRNDRSRRFDPE